MQSTLHPTPVSGRVLNFVLFTIISLYIVFVQGTDGDAITLDRLLFRHQQLLAGNSEFFNPWQYRILSTLVVEGCYQFVHLLLNNLDRITVFLALRVIQSIAIFFVADAYYRDLGIRNPMLRIAGILILAFGMANSVYHSDLSFSTFNDVLFYLLSGWLILNNRLAWLLPLTFFAALNRETSALIPFLAIAVHGRWKDWPASRKPVLIALACMAIYFAVYYTVRAYYGFQPPAVVEGMVTPMDYWKKNFGFLRTFPLITGTLGFVPLVVVIYFRRLPVVLQRWFWIVVPVWFIVHFSFSKAAESRLFLMPQALIFIPAFLWIIEGWNGEHRKESAPTPN